uniref:Uncharacterized protein n=1 Tax=Zea mays TaxID=4577 RepID=C4J2R9_MAIZE|nr:unknown [Zea mays]
MSMCNNFKKCHFYAIQITNVVKNLQSTGRFAYQHRFSQQINLQNWCPPHFLLVARFLLVDHTQQLAQDYQQTYGTPGTLHTEEKLCLFHRLLCLSSAWSFRHMRCM